MPSAVDKPLYILAPIMAFVPAVLTFAVIPIGPHLQVTDVNIGLLFIFAVSSMGIYGLVMAGWASNKRKQHHQ